MSDVPSVSSSTGYPAAGQTTGNDRAGALADDQQVHYVPGEHRFEIMLDGKPTALSPLEAVCMVLQNRYLALSDSTAQRTQEMQDQVNQINETNEWLNALKDAGEPDGSFTKPSGEMSDSMKDWMDKNDISADDLGSHPDDVAGLQAKFSSRVDQLSSTNELKMLALKTAVNKSQEALTAADGILQDLKQLMQTITNNMAR